MFFSSRLILTITDIRLDKVTAQYECDFIELGDEKHKLNFMVYPPGIWWRKRWLNFKLQDYEDNEQIKKLIEFLLYLREEGWFVGAWPPGPSKYVKLEMHITTDKLTVRVIDPINPELHYDFEINAEEIT